MQKVVSVGIEKPSVLSSVRILAPRFDFSDNPATAAPVPWRLAAVAPFASFGPRFGIFVCFGLLWCRHLYFSHPWVRRVIRCWPTTWAKTRKIRVGCQLATDRRRASVTAANTIELAPQTFYDSAMNQLVEIAWEDVRLPFNQWNSLDQLWLYITRNSHEFATSHCYGESRTAKWLQFTALSETRYPIAGVLQAGSALADRPVVARPNQPLQLPSGEKVTLFVGIPLWFNLKRGEDILLDTPFALLSDTWFGPDTRNGEVCYACPTHARLSMEGVARSAFKAITPVEIHNEDGAPLLIDKVNLPIPNL